MSCDVGKAAPPQSPTLTSLHLHHSAFSNPSAALPTSQLILQPFRCFSYVIGTSPTSQLILQPFCRFTYFTAHSTTLLLLHLRHRHFTYATAHSTTIPPLLLRHRSFYNPSVSSSTSHALQILHLASRPCIGGWKTVCGGLAYYSKLVSLEVAYSYGYLLRILLWRVNLFSFSHNSV